MHKMKCACLALASSVTLAATAVTFTAGNSEVVIASKPPPVVRFAAEEATNFLSRVLGAPVPIVKAIKLSKTESKIEDIRMQITLARVRIARGAIDKARATLRQAELSNELRPRPA